MLKKELRIQAKLDSGDFDKTVTDMQRKLKDIYTSSGPNVGIGLQDRLSKAGFGAAPTESQRRQADMSEKQSRRDLDVHIRDQVKAQDEMNRKLAEKLKILKDIESSESKSYQYTDKSKKVQEEINKLKGNLSQNQAGLNDSLNLRDQMRPTGLNRVAQGYQMGGFGGGARAFGREFAQNGNFALGTANSIAQIAQFGSSIYADRVSMPRQILESQGSAAMRGSDQLSNIFSGRSPFENIYSKEYVAANKIAKEEKERQRTSDKVGAGVGIGANVVAGATIGGIAGSAFFGAGAIPGAIIGGVGGLGRGVMQNMDQAGSGFGLFNNSYKERYESKLEDQAQAHRKSSLEALKNSNPMKKFGSEYFEQNYQRDLGIQRSQGLDDKGLYDFYNNSGDFTRNQHIQAAQGILSAGGSTQGANGLANTANQFSRDYRLTNAPQLLGALSGSTGDNSASSNSIVKILAEGTRLGFDTSKNAEELRKFTQIATDAVVRSGAKDSASAANIASRMSDFVSGSSMTDIGNARSAYQNYQSLASEGNGPRGVMQVAGMLKDPALKKLSHDQAYSLQNMTPENIMAGGPEIEAMAQAAGLTVKEFQERAVKNKDQSINIRAETDKTRDELRSSVDKDFGGDYNKAMQDSSFRIKAGKYMSAKRTDVGLLAKGTGRELEAAIAGDISQRSANGPSSSEAASAGPMAGDLVNKGIAEGEKEVNKVVQGMLGEFENASRGIKLFADYVVKVTQEAQAKSAKDPSNSGKYTQEANDIINNMFPNIQTTGGVPSK